MKRRLTARENIGYLGEKRAIDILKKEGYNIELWLHEESNVGSEPYDVVARKNSRIYLIDVKSSTSNKRRLPVHDHSLVDLINTAKKENKTPLILVVKPSSYSFIDPYDLISGIKLEGVYLYYCTLRNRKKKDIKDLLKSRAYR